MKVNVKKLDETISKLQELRRLATDPALAPFVAITGRSNGNGSSAQTQENGNGHSILRNNVLAACKALSGDFSIKDVYPKMEALGLPRSSEKSVANVLRALAVGGQIKLVQAGSGRRPTSYTN